MSYDIIRGLKITNQQVIITAASSNVYPKHYTKSESPSLTKILVEDGKSAVERIIVGEFLNGNFQGGTSIYRNIASFIRQEYGYTWDTPDEEVEKMIVKGIVEYRAQPIKEYKVLYDGRYGVTRFTKYGCKFSYSGSGKTWKGRYSDIKSKTYGDQFSIVEVSH